MKTRIFLFAAAVAALAGCSPLRWSNHPTRISGFTGLRPDPARPLAAPPDGPAPFIARMPTTPEEYSQAARRYFDEAERYRKEAASHQAMKALYGGTDQEMAAHCDTLALELSTLADRCEQIGRMLQKKAAPLNSGDKPAREKGTGHE